MKRQCALCAVGRKGCIVGLFLFFPFGRGHTLSATVEETMEHPEIIRRGLGLAFAVPSWYRYL